MKIYTSQANGAEKIQKALDYGVGYMLTPLTLPTKKVPGMFYCLDNGAYSAHRRGFPFNKTAFLRAINTLHDKGFTLDFIVVPDIITGGFRSMRYTHSFQREHLDGGGNLAMAIQDGITMANVTAYGLEEYTHIFIGGSVEWKWKHAKDWIDFAHFHKKKAHIGRCGQLKYLELAKELGADSVDSSSFNRNDSWHILDEFYKNKEGS